MFIVRYENSLGTLLQSALMDYNDALKVKAVLVYQGWLNIRIGLAT